MTRAELASEAYARAVGSMSVANYVPIFQGFMDKGIPESEIKPRENVFTFHAWRHQGRMVRKGEHGVRVQTWIPVDPDREEEKGKRRRGGLRPRVAFVFHVSQTDPVG